MHWWGWRGVLLPNQWHIGPVCSRLDRRSRWFTAAQAAHRASVGAEQGTGCEVIHILGASSFPERRSASTQLFGQTLRSLGPALHSHLGAHGLAQAFQRVAFECLNAQGVQAYPVRKCVDGGGDRGTGQHRGRGGLERTGLCRIGACGSAAHTRPDRFGYRRSNSATRASNVTAANNA